MGKVTTVTMVVAASADNVIGKDGKLPWKLPEDLRRFRELTMGHPVVMGRKTYESIGRPLPGRHNIVVSRQAGLRIPGCHVADSPDTALGLAVAEGASEVMVIGGETIYRDFLPMASRIHLTRVHVSVEGDAFFPELRSDEWQCTWSESHPPDAQRPLGFTFETYVPL